MEEKRKFPGELALVIMVLINSMAVTLMVKSDFGISTISSVPYIFHTAFPILSFGAWNYLFQTLLVVTLMVLRRKINLGYAVSFALGVLYGRMLDIQELWIAHLPDGFGWRVVYLIVAFLTLALGICLANNSGLPIIPTDVFPRDLSELLKKPYQVVKTTFDLGCLSMTILLSLLVLHRFTGIGVGTVGCAFLMGKTVSIIQQVLDRHFAFYRAVTRDRLKHTIKGHT